MPFRKLYIFLSFFGDRLLILQDRLFCCSTLVFLLVIKIQCTEKTENAHNSYNQLSELFYYVPLFDLSAVETQFFVSLEKIRKTLNEGTYAGLRSITYKLISKLPPSASSDLSLSLDLEAEKKASDAGEYLRNEK